MASPGTDIAAQLPVRSEADIDERVQVKVVDATNPGSQQMEVDTDNNAHVEVHGNKPTSGDDVALQLSEEGRPNPRGDYDAADNSKPASTALIAHDRNASPTEAHQNQRLTAVVGEDDTVCLDVAIRDESGQRYDQNNPLPVSVEESEGDEICDYYESPAPLVKNASDNHDYTVSALKNFILDCVWVTASGKASFEVQVETGVATDVWDTKAVAFNSVSSPNEEIPLKKKVKVAAGVRVRIIRTNLDNQSQTIYSTILGDEK